MPSTLTPAIATVLPAGTVSAPDELNWKVWPTLFQPTVAPVAVESVW